MSGGAFNYAYKNLVSDDVGLVLTSMRATDKYEEAAVEIRRQLTILADVLRAYEWWKCGDYSEDQFRMVLDQHIPPRGDGVGHRLDLEELHVRVATLQLDLQVAEQKIQRAETEAWQAIAESLMRKLAGVWD